MSSSEVVVASPKAELPSHLAEALESARAAERASRPADARVAYERVMYGLKPPQSGLLASDIARWIARTYAADGDIAAGLDCAELALGIAEAHDGDAAAASALNMMAILHQSCGDLEDATELYRLAEVRGDRAGDTHLVAMVRMNLGTIANIQGDFETALRQYESALPGFRSTASADYLGYVLNNLGMLYTDLERWSEAEVVFLESLECCELSQNVGTKVMVLTNYAEVLVASGRVAEAEEICESAWTLVSGLSDSRMLAELSKVHATVLRECGRFARSEQLLRSAAAIAEDRDDPLLQAEVLREQAVLFSMQDRNQETLHCLNRSHALFTRLRARKDVADLGRKLEGLETTFLAIVRRWGESIESADQYTQGHCVRVADYACALAEATGMDEKSLLWFRMGALLHDVGKIIVPSEVLNKPGGLTPEERMLIERHPDAGVELLAEIDFPWDIRPMVRFHHERWSGGGYPTGIAGEAIPLSARILAIADVFDALSSDRPYRKALSREKSLEIMRESMAGHFDPELLRVWEELCQSGAVVSDGGMVEEPTRPRTVVAPSAHVALVGNRRTPRELDVLAARWKVEGIEFTVLPRADELGRASTPAPVSAVVVALEGTHDCIGAVRSIREEHPTLPIIGVLDRVDEELSLRVVQAGAQECLLRRDVTPQSLRRCIRHAIERSRHLGDLHALSLRDDLTGLHNRRGLQSVAQRHLQAARRDSLKPILLFIDLDGLKEINDRLGHADGDCALMEMAGLLRTTFRAQDLIARIGGDEFVVLTFGYAGQGAEDYRLRIAAQIAERNAAPDRRYTLAASIGIAPADSVDTSLEELLSQADSDMYAQKRRQRQRWMPSSTDFQARAG